MQRVGELSPRQFVLYLRGRTPPGDKRRSSSVPKFVEPVLPQKPPPSAADSNLEQSDDDVDTHSDPGNSVADEQPAGSEANFSEDQPSGKRRL